MKQSETEEFYEKSFVFMSILALLASCSGQNDAFTNGSEIAEAEMTQKLVELYPIHDYNALKMVIDGMKSGPDGFSITATVTFDNDEKYVCNKVSDSSYLYTTTTYEYDYLKNGFYYRAYRQNGSKGEYTRIDTNGPALWYSRYDEMIQGRLHFVNNDFPFVFADMISDASLAYSKTFYEDEKSKTLSGVMQTGDSAGYSFLIRDKNLIRTNNDAGKEDYSRYQYIYEDIEAEYPNLESYTEISNDMYQSRHNGV